MCSCRLAHRHLFTHTYNARVLSHIRARSRMTCACDMAGAKEEDVATAYQPSNALSGKATRRAASASSGLDKLSHAGSTRSCWERITQLPKQQRLSGSAMVRQMQTRTHARTHARSHIDTQDSRAHARTHIHAQDPTHACLHPHARRAHCWTIAGACIHSAQPLDHALTRQRAPT